MGYLNLTVADLANLSPEQQLKLVADRLAGIKDPTVRAALAMGEFAIRVLDRRGRELEPRRCRKISTHQLTTQASCAMSAFHTRGG